MSTIRVGASSTWNGRRDRALRPSGIIAVKAGPGAAGMRTGGCAGRPAAPVPAPPHPAFGAGAPGPRPPRPDPMTPLS